MFKLELSPNKFTVINTVAETVFSGTVYDYNHIEFSNRGFLHFLTNYLQFETVLADYIHATLCDWVEINTNLTKE